MRKGKMEEKDFTSLFKDQKILVTGGTGTVGRAIVEELLKHDPTVIRIYSRDESKQFAMAHDLNHHPKLRFLIGDVRDAKRIQYALEDIDIVFHCAGMKHVPACEYNPFEAVKTNVIGTQNLIEAVFNEKVKKVIFTGTDKAANPTNTMGATKLLAERLISSANFYKGNRDTIFTSIRFGNVMGSRGSVIPLFRRQIEKGGPVTVTDGDITRFMMTTKDAVRLVFLATELAKGGEVFTLKMPALRLGDLIDVMITELAPKFGFEPEEIKIEQIGLRPGEKTYEEILTEADAKNAYENDYMYITPPVIMQDTFSSRYPNCRKVEERTYTSNDFPLLSKSEIRNLLEREGLLKGDNGLKSLLLLHKVPDIDVIKELLAE